MPLHVKSLHRMINIKAALRISTQVGTCNFRQGFETKSMNCSMLLTQNPTTYWNDMYM